MSRTAIRLLCFFSCQKEGDRNGWHQWSDGEGFVGAIKRFMVFEWMPGHLKAVYDV